MCSTRALHHITAIGTFFALLAVHGAGVAASGEVQGPPYSELIHKLGDPSFDVRASASDRLVRIGLAAKPVLMRAIKDDDLEVRMAAHRVLVRVSTG